MFGKITSSSHGPQMLPTLRLSPWHAPAENAERSMDINAALNAAMLASLSSQGQPRLTTPSFLDSPSLTSRNPQQWSHDPRIPQSSPRFLLDPNYPMPLVDQDHLALLRLNAIQGNTSIMEGYSRLGMASNRNYYQSPMAGSFLWQAPASVSNIAGFSSTLGASLRGTTFESASTET
jgi:ankyrin repeat protein